MIIVDMRIPPQLNDALIECGRHNHFGSAKTMIPSPEWMNPVYR
jgi:hypothetical protein